MPNLSKSRFCSGLQCLKRLYWQCFPPEDLPDDEDEFDLILTQGREVGELARQAFAGGALVDEDREHLRDALEHTRALMVYPNIPAVFEATFVHKDILVRVDVLERLSRNRWRLIEVKQSTKVKDEHIPDIAIQLYVLEQSGVSLGGVELMHVDSDYVYDGKKLRLDRLFKRADVAGEARTFQPQITRHLSEMRAALARRSAPLIEAGAQCSKPYECEFYALCNPELPFDHVSNLPWISAKKLTALKDKGIDSIRNVPDGFGLSDRQVIACRCVRTRKPYFGPELADALAELRYPRFFMDFETTNPAVPRYAGMRPFEVIPFQWSVHVQRQPGGAQEHYEYLTDGTADPRPAFLSQLLDAVERYGASGRIIVYNQSFEEHRLADLARWFPVFGTRIRKVQARLFDLLPVMREHVYHHHFCGSYSIKSVLPALVPGMAYEGMEVGEGGAATAAYEQLYRGLLSSRERARTRKALLAYCKQDTQAMAKLLDRLRREVAK